MPDALFIFGEIALITLCGYYGYEGIMRLWKPKLRVPSREWRDMVEPVVKKCRLAGQLDLSTCFHKDGSEALAALLEKMANELDRRS